MSIVKRLGEDWRCKGKAFIWIVQEFWEKSAEMEVIFNGCWVFWDAKRTGDRSLSCYNPAQQATPPGSGDDKKGGLRIPFLVSDESVKSVINYSISVDSVCSVWLSFFHGGHGWTRRGINDNDNVQRRVCCVRKRTVFGEKIELRHRRRCSVGTSLIIYPQMLDRCYTDFHLFQICLASVDCIGPQADVRCGQELPWIASNVHKYFHELANWWIF